MRGVPTSSRSAAPVVLRRGAERIRVAAWRGSSEVALLAPMPDAHPPGATLVAEALDEVARLGYARVVTGALSAREQIPFLQHGFDLRERLHLLAHDLRGVAPVAEAPLRRARRTDRDQVLAVDHLAFDDFWRLDQRGLDDALAATPVARFRVAEDAGAVVGYAICGRAGPRGYLQRLAVRPQSHGGGLGAALVLDALGWLVRRGATEAIVNTQESNERAFRLYQSLGFRAQPDGLAVFERSVGPLAAGR